MDRKLYAERLKELEQKTRKKSIREIGDQLYNCRSDAWKITYKVLCDKKGKEYPRWLKQWLATL
jgi:hypothetical protein